ncbi:MAG: gliding motility-associated C-terminal domain-containing protein [Bacteroidota bacterium]
MRKITLILISIIFIEFSLYATHNRAGEITFKHLRGYEYEVTVVTFTYTLSYADRPELEVFWGDGTNDIIIRVDTLLLPDYYRKNTYISTHTFPGAGTYEIVMIDYNRNDGVENIPGSVQVPFAIKTTFKIDPLTGYSDSPVLTYYPIDKAALHKLFIHNPGAYDPDGDSLSYKISTCLGEYGLDIPGYTLPPATSVVYVNEYTGDLVWDTPSDTGIYNVAMLIEEWRNGVKIGKIVRDMQIEVVESDNDPPVINALNNYCIEAGSTLQFTVTATDSDGDGIQLMATGGPFMLVNSPANFPTVFGSGSVTGTFTWNTNCSHVREQPYQVLFRAKDNNPEVNLVNLKNVNIKVICPAPVLDSIEPSNNRIKLYWHPSICSEVTGYDIYRRLGYYGYIPGFCETGVPAYTGYEWIDSTGNHLDTTYIDNNQGEGLNQGYEYCYMIVARFDDGAESYPSIELCSDLVKGIPVITHVSVDSSDAVTGKIYLEWSKATEFDTILAPGPYKYLIYRSDDIWGDNMQLIDSLSDINDTIYLDSMINTVDNPSSYKIEFYNDQTGNRFLIGPAMIASSVWLDILGADNTLTINMEKNVPWINYKYIIYRKNNLTFSFDSIGFTDIEQYVDSFLKNNVEYCYQVKSLGRYLSGSYADPLINISHRNCGIPVDTIPSCPPVLRVSGDCDNYFNQLSWTNPNKTCSDDVVCYYLYYKPTVDEDFLLIDSVNGATNTDYQHFPALTMAGCYVVTAVDSFKNESAYSNRVCINECTYYVLPNIFTPNGDNLNDIYKPGPYRFVQKVDMKIYDRWGVLIFETEDPDINWDGRYHENNKIVVDGIYYYLCDVYEYRLSGLEPRTLVGFIQVLTAKEIENK